MSAYYSNKFALWGAIAGVIVFVIAMIFQFVVIGASMTQY